MSESEAVPNLLELCRGAIWKAMVSPSDAPSNANAATARSLYQNFQQLPLPPLLVRYIAFE